MCRILAVVAASLIVAGALPSGHESLMPSAHSPSRPAWHAPALGAAAPARPIPCLRCLRGGGLFFGSKRIPTPRFEPPPPYSKPVHKDSAWGDLQVCLAAMARLVFRIVFYLCRLVARLLIRIVFSVLNVVLFLVGGLSGRGWSRPAVAGREPYADLEPDWFERSAREEHASRALCSPSERDDTRATSVLHQTDRPHRGNVLESPPPYQTPLNHASSKAEAALQTDSALYTDSALHNHVHGRLSPGTDDDSHSGHGDSHAYTPLCGDSEGSHELERTSEVIFEGQRQSNCGQALPEHMWKQRAEDLVTQPLVTQPRSNSHTTPPHSTSAVSFVEEESHSSSRNTEFTLARSPEAGGGMDDGTGHVQGERSNKTGGIAALTKNSPPFTPSKSFFTPSPFCVFSGEADEMRARNNANAQQADIQGRFLDAVKVHAAEATSAEAVQGGAHRLITKAQTPNASNHGLVFSIQARAPLQIEGIGACSNVYAPPSSVSSAATIDAATTTDTATATRGLRYQVWMSRVSTASPLSDELGHESGGSSVGSERQGGGSSWQLVGEQDEVCLSRAAGAFKNVALNLLPGGVLQLGRGEQVRLCLLCPTSPAAVAFRY